jgi:hypothetical protein
MLSEIALPSMSPAAQPKLRECPKARAICQPTLDAHLQAKAV